MKKSHLFAGLLLGAMLPMAALCTPNVTGKWSGTLHKMTPSLLTPRLIFDSSSSKLSQRDDNVGRVKFF